VKESVAMSKKVASAEIVRFSVSLESDLLNKFDRYCREGKFATRSEAMRRMIRDTLTRESWDADSSDMVGTLTLLFDHHRSQIRDQLVDIQHDHTDRVVSTLHVHLSHDICLEVIVLRGPANQLQALASQLRGIKGVLKGELVIASAKP
jgi:CopG family nickel-responsive transcriptional regulator